MGKTEPRKHPQNGNGRVWQTSTNDLGIPAPVGFSPTDISSNADPSPSQISDLRISAEKIRHFADLDLGELVDLPGGREDFVALSIRMDAAFSSLLDSALQLVAKDHEEIARETLEAISQELALGFVGRYGTLAFCSLSVLRVLWSAQRLKSAKGPKFLRQVGERLAIFVATQKGWSPQGSIDIAFTLGKPQFLAELEELSRELGASQSNDSKAKQLLRLARTGKHAMLRPNLRQLEQFLECDQINPYLHAKNEVAANWLAQYGARGLTSDTGESITPDWFFYTWVAWMVNKSPKTVRRLIQTAESKLRTQISGYEKTYKR